MCTIWFAPSSWPPWNKARCHLRAWWSPNRNLSEGWRFHELDLLKIELLRGCLYYAKEKWGKKPTTRSKGACSNQRKQTCKTFLESSPIGRTLLLDFHFLQCQDAKALQSAFLFRVRHSEFLGRRGSGAQTLPVRFRSFLFRGGIVLSTFCVECRALVDSKLRPLKLESHAVFLLFWFCSFR